MDEETYLKALEDNPQLIRRPDLIQDASQNTRDFKFDDSNEEEEKEGEQNDQIVEDEVDADAQGEDAEPLGQDGPKTEPM